MREMSKSVGEVERGGKEGRKRQEKERERGWEDRKGQRRKGERMWLGRKNKEEGE